MLKKSIKTLQKRHSTLRVMSFKVGHLHLALSLEGVQKVIPKPTVLKGNQPFLGLTQIDDQEIIVLDLYQRILGTAAPENTGFLVIFQAKLNTYGLTTASLPAMQEIPLETIRPVPTDYRDRDALGIAAQMAEIPQGDAQSITLLLLDPDALLQLVQVSMTEEK